MVFQEKLVTIADIIVISKAIAKATVVSAKTTSPPACPCTVITYATAKSTTAAKATAFTTAPTTAAINPTPTHLFIVNQFAAFNATTDATTPADDTSIPIRAHTDAV